MRKNYQGLLSTRLYFIAWGSGDKTYNYFVSELKFKNQMKKIPFLINLFSYANCLCPSLEDIKENTLNFHFKVSNHDLISILNNSTQEIQTSVDQLSELVADNKNHTHDCQNQSSSISQSNLDEFQKNLIEKTEKLIDQKFASFSEDLKKLALNTDELQTSVDQLSAVAQNITNMNEEHKDISSILKTLGNQLESIQNNFSQFKTQILANDCSDLYNSGENVSSSYFFHKYNRKFLCDMETDNGGWLLIQQRKKLTKQVDFHRDWASYKEGFGTLDTEFWIGNEFLHRITNQKSYELRIEMEDFEKGPFYVTYSKFRVGNEESGYKLQVLGVLGGNVDDNLHRYHNNNKFSTFDRDNDNSVINCAKVRSGGFWYDGCGTAHMNGLYPTVPDRKNTTLIYWTHDAALLILVKVEMKIRPKK